MRASPAGKDPSSQACVHDSQRAGQPRTDPANIVTKGKPNGQQSDQALSFGPGQPDGVLCAAPGALTAPPPHSPRPQPPQDLLPAPPPRRVQPRLPGTRGSPACCSRPHPSASAPALSSAMGADPHVTLLVKSFFKIRLSRHPLQRGPVPSHPTQPRAPLSQPFLRVWWCPSHPSGSLGGLGFLEESARPDPTLSSAANVSCPQMSE